MSRMWENVSDTAKVCPHCGYELKPKIDPELKRIKEERVKKMLKKKKPIFLIITILLLIGAFISSPTHLGNFSLLIIASSIIAIARKEKYVGLAIVGIIIGVLLLFAESDLNTYINSKSGSETIQGGQDKSIKSRVQILSTTDEWGGEGYKYHWVKGEIENIDNNTIKTVAIEGVFPFNVKWTDQGFRFIHFEISTDWEEK